MQQMLDGDVQTMEKVDKTKPDQIFCQEHILNKILGRKSLLWDNMKLLPSSGAWVTESHTNEQIQELSMSSSELFLAIGLDDKYSYVSSYKQQSPPSEANGNVTRR